LGTPFVGALEIRPFTRDEAAVMVATARERLPEWYPWVLCGLRTGMRAGELLALQWGDFNWRHGYVQVQRNIVRGLQTSPKNHQSRRVDLSRQLRVALRVWRVSSAAPGSRWVDRFRSGCSRR
jgi:integrase